MEKARQHPALVPVWLALAVALGPATFVRADEPATEVERVTLASGLEAWLLDSRIEEGDGESGPVLRLRYVSEALGPDDDHAADMQALCEQQALPRIRALEPSPTHVVITLADRPVPFGEAAPDAFQIFESYQIDQDRCIWELF